MQKAYIKSLTAYLFTDIDGEAQAKICRRVYRFNTFVTIVLLCKMIFTV
jgi:hypothetical protein